MLMHLVARWEAALAACARLGGDSRELVVAQSASESEISSVEQELGRRLPASLRAFFADFSSHVEVRWFLPDRLETPFRGVFSGEFHASLALLAQFSEAHAGWVRGCFNNPTDPYDAVWHNKLPFLEVGNGDFIAIDTSTADGPVVYLSHDDGEGHGHVLGTTFNDFVERHSRIGCVGAEDWQWLHFWSPSGLLDATCPAAVQWRQWFRLTIDATAD